MARASLQDTTVLRAGATARQWSRETQEVSCDASDKIELRFEMSAAGRGTTEVLIQIGSRDFSTLVKTMCAVDHQSTMATMATELAREVAAQQEHDATQVQRGQNSVVDLAHAKFSDAAPGHDDAEWFIYEHVKKLVEELSPDGGRSQEERSET